MCKWFHRVGKCAGVTVWPGRTRVEVWLCRGTVAEHRHPEQRVEVMMVAGRARFWRRPNIEAGEVQAVRWLWKWLTVPAGWAHGFEVESRWMVSVNVTFDGRSAAENFVQ
jgi:quercetin dioxygenase-like cupin family protein